MNTLKFAYFVLYHVQITLYFPSPRQPISRPQNRSQDGNTENDKEAHL